MVNVRLVKWAVTVEMSNSSKAEGDRLLEMKAKSVAAVTLLVNKFSNTGLINKG